MNTYTTKIEKKDEACLKTFLSTKDVLFENMQYASFRAKGDGFVAVLYESGKFVLQGSNIDSVAHEIELNVLKKNMETIQQTSGEDEQGVFVAHIGVDESGKGDYFGPLIIAGVYVDETNRQKFIDLGIKDSKKLTDIAIRKMAIEIKNNAIFSVVTIGPQKYNELYAKFKNLNKLLAWGHARVIENILEKQKAEYALSDKFGDEALIRNALMENGRKIRLEQRTKAESDIAVACGSVIARYEFVKNLTELSRQIGIDLPKGASEKVLQTGKLIYQKYGEQGLTRVAKIHFKTTSEILNIKTL